MLPRLHQLEDMMESIARELDCRGLPSDLLCDHVCYRVATLERYHEMKRDLLREGTLVAETPVNGRPISIVRLAAPYRFRNQVIECVELPAPKPGSPYEEGWEHAEFVTGEKMEAFLARHSSVSFEMKSLGKEINPEIALAVPPIYQMKFHPTSILDVIDEERRRGFL